MWWPWRDKLDRCRQRVQQETLGHRGRSGDPLYGIRRVARTRAGLLTAKPLHRLAKVFTDQRHVAFASVYQDVIDAYQADQATRWRWHPSSPTRPRCPTVAAAALLGWALGTGSALLVAHGNLHDHLKDR